MAIMSECPSCKRQVRVPDDMRDKMVKCPRCLTTFKGVAVPERPEPWADAGIRELDSPREGPETS